MKWQAISSPVLHLRAWEDELVVYNSLSGDTHLLEPLAGLVFTQLRHAPSDETSLVESLCQAQRTEPDAELSLQVRQILADLHTLALIEEVA